MSNITTAMFINYTVYGQNQAQKNQKTQFSTNRLCVQSFLRFQINFPFPGKQGIATAFDENTKALQSSVINVVRHF